MNSSPKLYSIACELQRTANIPRFAKNQRIIAHLEVPSTITFAQLHTAINNAFDFPETHIHDFRIYDADIQATDSESPNLRRTGGEAPCLLHISISNQLTGGGSTELDEAKTILSEVVEDPAYRSKYMEYVFGRGEFSRHSVDIQNHPNPAAAAAPQGIRSLDPENLEWHPLGREALMEMEEEEHCKQNRNPTRVIANLLLLLMPQLTSRPYIIADSCGCHNH